MRYLSVNKNTVRNREGIAHTITLLQNIMLSFFYWMFSHVFWPTYQW